MSSEKIKNIFAKKGIDKQKNYYIIEILEQKKGRSLKKEGTTFLYVTDWIKQI